MFGYKRVKPPEPIFPSCGELKMTELRQAMTDLAEAQRNFENASPEYFEIANARLTAAKEKLNACYAWTKEE